MDWYNIKSLRESTSCGTFFCFYFILFCITSPAHSQGISNIIIDESINGKKLNSYLSAVEKQYSIDFIYNDGIVNALTVNGVTDRIDLDDYLEVLLAPFDMK